MHSADLDFFFWKGDLHLIQGIHFSSGIFILFNEFALLLNIFFFCFAILICAFVIFIINCVSISVLISVILVPVFQLFNPIIYQATFFSFFHPIFIINSTFFSYQQKIALVLVNINNTI